MKYLSLFSGVGGFELGINNLAECIGYSEIEERAISIYRKHFPHHNYLGDVTKIDESKLPDFELLVGGFPCQAFSIAGRRKGFDDTRGTLFFEIARIAKSKQPRHLLLENVKGLVSHDKGQTFKIILETLWELGYSVEWGVLNSRYFGVAQNRERVFIHGYLRDQGEPKIFPITEDDRQHIQVGGSKAEVTGTINCCLSKMGNKQDAKSRVLVKVNGKIRRLTPIECECLMGLPSDWTKFGICDSGKLIQIPDRSRYICCGNAVVPSVVNTIIRKMV